MYLTSVDPGLQGAFVTIDHNYEIIRMFKMPIIKSTSELSIVGIHNILSQYTKMHIICETQIAMPSQSVKSTLTSGQNWGKLVSAIQSHQLLCDAEISLDFVTPTKWTNFMHKGIIGKDSKEKTLKAVLQRIPVLPDMFYKRTGSIHSGYLDALAMCIFFLENNLRSK